jgi:hypothetical protein
VKRKGRIVIKSSNAQRLKSSKVKKKLMAKKLPVKG